jgi:hypothetical protein
MGNEKLETPHTPGTLYAIKSEIGRGGIRVAPCHRRQG